MKILVKRAAKISDLNEAHIFLIPVNYGHLAAYHCYSSPLLGHYFLSTDGIRHRYTSLENIYIL